MLRIVARTKLDERCDRATGRVAPTQLAELVALIDDDTITGKIAKDVFDEMVETGKDRAAHRRGARASSRSTDTGAIEAAIDDVLATNPDQVAEYRAGKDKLFGFFVGQVMKATEGKANPQQVNEILRARLQT